MPHFINVVDDQLTLSKDEMKNLFLEIRKERPQVNRDENDEAERRTRTLHICLDRTRNESVPRPFHRDLFTYLAEPSVRTPNHLAVLSFCCGKKFKVRQSDLSVCAHVLSSFHLHKGSFEELDLPSFVDCVKMSSFVLVNNRHDKQNKTLVKFTSGFPLMPYSLTELNLSYIQNLNTATLGLAESLHYVRALSSLTLEHMTFQIPLTACPAFSSLRTLTARCVKGIDPTESFWRSCTSLETLSISNIDEDDHRKLRSEEKEEESTPFFPSTVLSLLNPPMPLLSPLLSQALTTISLVSLCIPTLPPSICMCAKLVSLTVTSCGLLSLPDDMLYLTALENLSLTNNSLTLDGIMPLKNCSYFLLPPSGLYQRESRCISLCGNRLPDGTPDNLTVVSHLRSLPTSSSSTGVRSFDYTMISNSTNSFSPEFLLSNEGAFGPVYRVPLSANFSVAVKVMRDITTPNTEIFMNEVATLKLCLHPNLLQLLGCSLNGPSACIVYEYKSMGSLRQLLSRERIHDAGQSSRPVLRWKRRLCILMQIASAVEYLHVVLSPPIIHRDIKSANILLDNSLNASLGDFGLARLTPEVAKDASSAHASTRIFGTPGYIDPEYAQTGRVSLACDIFSLGILFLEMLSSRYAYDPTHDPPALVSAFEESVEDDSLLTTFLDASPSAAGWTSQTASGLIALAKNCLKSRGSRRPNITAIISTLSAEGDKWACHPIQIAASSCDVLGGGVIDCTICLDQPSTHACVPCGHRCMCEGCGGAMTQELCPICRTPVERIIKIFD
jgi:hypothetical protein